MRGPSANFLTDKNLETNKPIWLYRINITDSPASGEDGDIYLAEYNEDVAYYETNSGASTARSYLAFPISHGGVTENTENRIDSLEINIANVSRDIQSFVELYDGLRDHKVTLRRVFATHLADSSAYVEDIYYIDSVTASAETISFRLTSRLDILKVNIPRRRYLRNHCPWAYKGEGCWFKADGENFTQPKFFNTELMNLSRSEYEGSASNAVIATETFTHGGGPTSFDATRDSFQLELRVFGVSGLSASSQIEVSSSTSEDTEEYFFADMTTLGLKDGEWKTIEIPFSDMTETGGTFDPTDIKRISVYSQANEPLYIEWKNAKILVSHGTYVEKYMIDDDTVKSTHSYAYLQFGATDIIGLDKTTDSLVLDMKADGEISPDGYVGILDEALDVSNSWRFDGLRGHGITSDWKTITLPLALFSTIGAGLSTSSVMRVQWFEKPASGSITYSIRNAKIHVMRPYAFGDGADVCAKTLKDCRRHNNVLQFGGYPDVPSRRVFRA